MRQIAPFITLSLTVALVYLLNSPMGSMPAIGKLLDPVNGFWEQEGDRSIGETVKLPGLKSTVTVHFDERRVPHIFANSMEDASYVQGYVTARDRLWQMEFQVFAAAGRLSELFGPDFETAGDGLVLKRDRMQRRFGIGYAAELALEAVKQDQEVFSYIEAYSAGVNKYIDELSYADLPIEYKLLGYEPEHWSPLKTAYLLKYMGDVLSSTEHDLDYTKLREKLGAETFSDLFPDGKDNTSPIVPRGVEYNFDGLDIDTPELNVAATAGLDQSFRQFRSNPHLGSNNWAISGAVSNTGKPILCNDPHLMLNLPSLWYEVQLHTPEVNVYGVTFPGAPGVVIGFNENVAWGVTNAGRDVRDWYKIDFETPEMKRYRFEGEWRDCTTRIETIHRKGGEPYVDTVVYTHHGPVVYDATLPKDGVTGFAMRWELHQPSNEMKTFLMLNRARNYEDYRKALVHFKCPGQNFVFASNNGDIGITQQGRFPARWPQQGRYLMDGSKAANDWQGYIPFEHNATIRNPEWGFVSSANQFPADSTYPYYLSGNFARNRCRRINERLTEMTQQGNVSSQDLMDLQLDNYNYTAADALPVMLEAVAEADLSAEAAEVLANLKSWNYMHDPDSKEASYFKSWWKKLLKLTWDEFDEAGTDKIERPNWYRSAELMRNRPNDPFFDKLATTDKVESFQEVAVEALELISQENLEAWSEYKGTKVQHLIKSLEPFSATDFRTGGDRRIVNAMGVDFGPSWRMVVEVGEWPKAYGVYPGGQSGNPGSPYYDNFIANWSVGKYFELELLRDGSQLPSGSSTTVLFQPN